MRSSFSNWLLSLTSFIKFINQSFIFQYIKTQNGDNGSYIYDFLYNNLLITKLSTLISTCILEKNIYSIFEFLPFEMGCEHSAQQHCVISEEIVKVYKEKNRHKNIKNFIKLGLKNNQNVLKLNQKLTKDDCLFLSRTFSRHFIFSQLEKLEIMRLIQFVQIYKAQKDVLLFKKGDQANLLFVIKTGVVELEISENKYKRLSTGDCFGELALIYRSPRTATARVMQPCTFFCISQAFFQKTIQQMAIRNFDFIKKYVLQASIFKFLTSKQKTMIAHKSQVLNFNRGDCIYKQGDPANVLYIITRGLVELQNDQKQVKISACQFFGQQCIQNTCQKRRQTATSLTDAVIISIGSKQIEKYAKLKIYRLAFYSTLRRAFKQNNLLKNLVNKSLQKVLTLVEIRWYKNGTNMAKQNQFYVCLEGAINNKGTGSVHNLDYLVQAARCSKWKILNQIIKNQDGYVGVFNIEIFQQVSDCKLLQIFKTNEQNQLKTDINNIGIYIQINKLYVKQQFNSEYQHYHILHVQQKNGYKYMLICIKNEYQIQQQLKNNNNYILDQIEIIQKLQPQHSIQLLRTQKQQQWTYILTSFIGFQTISSLLLTNLAITKQQLQFFMASMVCQLQQFHLNNVILRNITAQSIIIARKQPYQHGNGYPTLIDYSDSKKLNQNHGFRTFTIVGSPYYLAPQIIIGKGYSFPVDFWALGILYYEILCGKVPYGNQLDDPYSIFQQIYLNTSLPVPQTYIEPSNLNLIRTLLSRNQSQRSVQNIIKIKSMQFFQGINWTQIQSRKLKSPFKIKKNIASQTFQCTVQQFLA